MNDWNHLADVIGYDEAADEVRAWASARDHYLIFMPEMEIPDWPHMLDIPEFVVVLDKGIDEVLRITPAFWLYAQRLLTGLPVRGLIAVPKTVPVALVRQEVGTELVDVNKDILICRGEEERDRQQVPIQRLLVEAIRCIDPEAATSIATAAGL